MTMADVRCERCGHLMSCHTQDHTVTIIQTNGCTKCGCAIGEARRDDLEDKITDLEIKNRQLQDFVNKVDGEIRCRLVWAGQMGRDISIGMADWALIVIFKRTN